MQLKETVFQNHKAVEITTTAFKMVVITDTGPRIAFFGKPDSGNLLLWQEGQYFRKQWELRGGHRVWTTRPLADECEETYQLDTAPCEVTKTSAGWDILAPEHPDSCTRKGLNIRVLADNKLEVDNYLINTGNLLYSCGMWGLTCTVPGKTTRYAIPLGEDNLWDYCKIVMFRKWEKHTGGYDDTQFSFGADMLFVDPQGRENKRMVQADKGLIAMRDTERDVLFAKKVIYDRAAAYPQGCNLAIYVGPDNFMVEMETMGAEKTIKPGESVHNTETWVLTTSRVQLETDALLKLF